MRTIGFILEKEYAEIVDLGIKNFKVITMKTVIVPNSWYLRESVINTIKVEQETCTTNFRLDTWYRNVEKELFKREVLQYVPSFQGFQHLNYLF